MNADLSEVNKDPQTYEIIGAAMEVHRDLGHGFPEALDQLTGVDESQLINEPKPAGLHRGLLLNSGATSLEYKRLVFNLRQSSQSAERIENINLIGA